MFVVFEAVVRASFENDEEQFVCQKDSLNAGACVSRLSQYSVFVQHLIAHDFTITELPGCVSSFVHIPAQ